MFYNYILHSLKTDKLYIGFTDNWKRRLDQHNSGECKATKPYIPYELVYCACFINENDALASEKYFKSTAGWKRIHQMLAYTLKITVPLSR
jgi:putative endonuclease